MKKLDVMTWLVCVGFSLSLLVTGCKKSEEPGPEGQGTAAKAKEEMKEAAEATGEYLSEQKDKFMKEAKDSYASLESQTNQLIADLKNESSEKWQQTKTELTEKLQAVKTKLDELAQKSDRAWEESKQELSDALDKLKEAYEQARAEFQKEKGQT